MHATTDRLVPALPPTGRRLKVLIDTDFANEIDDLYAVALALCSPERFEIVGLNATHFAQKAGPETIAESYDLLQEMLGVASRAGTVPVARGSHPMRYLDEPCPSDGVDLIVEHARAASPDDPLWVVALGAASTVASAVLLAPDILPRVRLVFHARSELTWPTHNDQFNVWGDIRAARALLASDVPLVWFDTGQQLVCPMEVTAARLAPCGRLGAFLHAFRGRNRYFQSPTKGFFDIADIAWMMQPDVCAQAVIPAPAMNWAMRFDHNNPHGRMLRVSSVRADPTWELFFDRLRRGPFPA
jgi:inosine-uridine nucleoside N-ribohydrolase